MSTYSLFICNKVIRIESECGNFVRQCRGYIVKEPAPEPDYIISVSHSDIYDLKKRSASYGFYGMDMLEGFVILRKLAEQLLVDERTLFVHGSVVAYKDSAYLFTADSGVGKTTHSRLWTSNLNDAYILNGDKPFISTNEKVIAWGSPWCGSERYGRNEGVELKAICLLQRADTNAIFEISPEEALPILARQTGDPNCRQDTRLYIIEGLYNIAKKVRFYKFEMNNFAEDAFATSYQALTKLN